MVPNTVTGTFRERLATRALPETNHPKETPMNMTEALQSARAAATATLMILAAGTLVTHEAKAADTTLHNLEVIDASRDSWISATAVNTSGETLERPKVVIDVDGRRIVHIGPITVEPGDAWHVLERIPSSNSLHSDDVRLTGNVRCATAPNQSGGHHGRKSPTPEPAGMPAGS